MQVVLSVRVQSQPVIQPSPMSRHASDSASRSSAAWWSRPAMAASRSSVLMSQAPPAALSRIYRMRVRCPDHANRAVSRRATLRRLSDS